MINQDFLNDEEDDWSVEETSNWVLSDYLRAKESEKERKDERRIDVRNWPFVVSLMFDLIQDYGPDGFSDWIVEEENPTDDTDDINEGSYCSVGKLQRVTTKHGFYILRRNPLAREIRLRYKSLTELAATSNPRMYKEFSSVPNLSWANPQRIRRRFALLKWVHTQLAQWSSWIGISTAQITVLCSLLSLNTYPTDGIEKTSALIRDEIEQFEQCLKTRLKLLRD
jgi:hypothetical protein